MTKRSMAAIAVCSGGFLLMGSSSLPTPPAAPRKDHVHVYHGERFPDPYHWLRQKASPEVEKYLEDENAYTVATSADVQPFADRLYAEMLGRIKQTDLSVPTRRGRFYYYRRTVEGLQYPIRCRRPAAADGSYSEDAPEQVLLDQNEMAKGLKFLSIGEFEVSDDEQQLLYTTDTTGYRQYTLFAKDLATEAVRGPLAERVTSAAWAADNRTFFYVTEDPGAVDSAAKHGSLSLRFGLGWAKAQSFHTGQTPVLKYNRQLMQAILHDRLPIADIVNARVISLEDAAQGYETFDQGAAVKFVLDPHGELAA